MTLNLPYQVRAAIYVIVVMGTAILVPLNVAGVVSEVVMSVWTSVAGAASALAALNISRAD